MIIKLTINFAALIALALLSFLLSFAHFGAAGLWIALAIALAKAVLVVLVFMEIAHGKATSVLAFLAALSFVALFIGMTVAEKLTRASPPLSPPTSSMHVRASPPTSD
jgi:cytochrome c oxidase subunit IV